MKAPVKFAVVGCGHIGKRHAAMIQAATEAQLVAVVDNAWQEADLDDLGRAGSWAEGAQAHTSLSQALQAHDVDVVAVATPNGSHVELACQAIDAGCHVVLEKPMGLDATSVEGLQARAHEAGLLVFGVMQNRHAPAAEWLNVSHGRGQFGDILQVHVQCLWNRDHRYYTPGSWRGTMDQDGGPLFTQFSHFVDILMWVFGPLEVQDAHFVNQTHQDVTEFEDGGIVRFQLKEGGWGTLTFSTATPHGNFESSMTVVGTKGTLRIGGQYMDRVEDFNIPGCDHPALPASPPANDYGGYIGSAANHHHVYDNVLDVLLRNGEVATPIEEGLAVVRAIEHMNRLGRRHL